MRRREFCLGLVAMPALARSAFAQEVSTITLIKQHGLPYLPMMLMEEFKLVEKHAAKLGIANLKTDYRTLGGTQSLIDALIAGQMHFGIAGVPGLATLWDKTVGTPNEVRGLCAAQAMPFLLVTSRPHIKSIKDFKEGDKIAVPGIKNSNQAICLQMAAAKEWGQANYAQLDPFTITLPHPDAAIAIISKSSELTAHYGVSPFQNYEVAAPGTHVVLKSYDTLGGPTTNGVVFMAKKFRDANPKVTSAVYAAFEEVSEFIRKEPRQSAEVYIRMTNDKRSNADEMAKMILDPDNVWATTPLNAMRYVEFMNKVGTVKKVPADWRDLFMPESHGLKGELMAQYRLYCIGASGNSYKVALYLNCAGLDWEPVGIDFAGGVQRDAAWRDANNAMGEVPVLEAAGKRMSQSGAILTWLAETTGKYAVDPDDRFEALRWMFFDNHKFTNNYAMHRFQRCFTPQPVHESVLAFLHARVKASFAVAEKHLSGRRFMLGDTLTIVDFSMAGYVFYPPAETGFDIASAYPAIDAWRKRIAALPGWKPPYEMMPVGSDLPVRVV